MRWLVIAGLGVFAACGSGTPLSDLSVDVEMRYQDGEVVMEASVEDIHSPPGQDTYSDPKLHLAVRLRGQEIALAKRYVESPYAAMRMIDSPLTADEEVLVIVEQDGERAEVSTTAPPPLTLAAPTDAHATQPITVTWSPTAKDPMEWQGGCYDENYGPIPHDTGSLTFPAGVISAMYNCDALLTFSRTRTSIPDSDLGSAVISISQSFPVAFQVRQ